MRQKIRKIASNPLISGSFFLFSGGIIGNLFNFIFNLYMSRNLRVEDYGVLISLVSIISLLSIPAGAFTPTILTLAGKYYAKDDGPHLHAFYFKMLKPLIIMGFSLLVLFVAFSGFVGSFFHIRNPLLLVISAFSIFLVYIATLSSSFLQAKLAFRSLTFTSAFAAAVKVVFGIILVLAGWGLGGAVTGLFISFIAPVLIGIILLWKIIFYKSEKPVALSYKELLSYGIPSAIVIFSLNAFITTDILLVKHLFPELQAGQYAGMSLIGRVIFFLTAPISTVMFPIIINRINTNQDYKKVLITALVLVGGISSIMTIFYYLFPEFTIQFFLKNAAYLPIAKNLGRFGIFITIYSIVSLLAYYFLSVKKTAILRSLLVGAVLQAILILIFHDNFTQIIDISIFILIFIFFFLLYKFQRFDK